MRSRRPWLPLVIGFLLLSVPGTAQTLESAGSRAPGMGGAFVAVANDSSAAWWNPAGLAAGPFLDLALSWNLVESVPDAAPAWRTGLSSFALGTPPAGVSYYRFRLTGIAPIGTTATGQGDRQGTRADAAIRSVPATQLGVTLVHTVIEGIHVGTTLKYVRGKVLDAVGDGSPGDLLDVGEGLEGGDSGGTFDLDTGVLAVAGAIRVGVVGRNLRHAALGARGAQVRLPRQVRAGAAFDGGAIGLSPLTIAVDADLRRYDAPAGARRVIAIGAEQWFAGRRVAVRGGGRLNTAGAEEHAGTLGTSVSVRAGLYVDAHAVLGGASDEQGWGVAARVSF